MSGKVRAYVAVGANIAPEHHIPEALVRLAGTVELQAVSTFYWTEPLGGKDQPAYLNGVAALDTTLTARALKFDVLRPTEASLGRIRTADAYAPRPIDLDIAVFGAQVWHEPDLRIPDPEIRERPFVAVPLLELAPDLTFPDTGEELRAVVEKMGAPHQEAAEAFTKELRARLHL